MGGTTGITTTGNENVTLQTGDALSIDQAVNVGTGERDVERDERATQAATGNITGGRVGTAGQRHDHARPSATNNVDTLAADIAVALSYTDRQLASDGGERQWHQRHHQWQRHGDSEHGQYADAEPERDGWTGTITLLATGGGSDILVNKDVDSTSGNITATAGGNVTLSTGNISTAGNVSLTGTAGMVSETVCGLHPRGRPADDEFGGRDAVARQ